MENKDALESVKEFNNVNQKEVEIKEDITIDKAQQLYQKYITVMKILEDK